MKASTRKAKAFHFLAIVLILSIPFYLLNLINLRLPMGLPPSVLMIVVPMITAIFMTFHESGKSGLMMMLRQTLHYPTRDDGCLLALSILAVPVMTALTYIISLTLGRQDGAGVGAMPRWETLPLIFIFYYLGAIPEELGWTAYATGPLQERMGVLKTGFIIGIVWQLWHLIPFIMQGRSVEFIVFHSLAGIASRIIMGHLHTMKKDRFWPSNTYHAMLNFSIEALPAGIHSYDPLLMMLLSWGGVVLVQLIKAKNDKGKHKNESNENTQKSNESSNMLTSFSHNDFYK